MWILTNDAMNSLLSRIYSLWKREMSVTRVGVRCHTDHLNFTVSFAAVTPKVLQSAKTAHTGGTLNTHLYPLMCTGTLTLGPIFEDFRDKELPSSSTLFRLVLITSLTPTNIVPTQVEKMRAKLASLNDCAVPFLSRTVANLCRLFYSSISVIRYHTCKSCA